MKTSFAFLAFAGLVLSQVLAAPSAESTVEDTHVNVDTTSSLIEAGETLEDTNRAKKSTQAVCSERTDDQGRSFLQCSDSAADSEIAATYSAPLYGPAPSYGGSSGGYGGSAPSYKVFRMFVSEKSEKQVRRYFPATTELRWIFRRLQRSSSKQLQCTELRKGPSTSLPRSVGKF